jgi:protein SCO1/2
MAGMDPPPAHGTKVDQALGADVLDLPLTGADGMIFTLASLKGKTVVLGEFLTTCQEVCPLTSVNLREVASDAAKAGLGDSVEILEGTVDPERDDPARLTAYQQLFGLQPGWKLFTAGAGGTSALWKAFDLDFKHTPENADSPAPTDWLTGKPLTYDVDHDDKVFVIGPDGHIRWVINGTPDTRGQKPPAKLDQFLNDEGRNNLTHPGSGSWTVRDVTAALTEVTGRHIGR